GCVEHDGRLKPVRLDVRAEGVKLLVRHHREHIGGGMNFVLIAPRHGRALPERPISIGHCLRWRLTRSITTCSTALAESWFRRAMQSKGSPLARSFSMSAPTRFASSSGRGSL